MTRPNFIFCITLLCLFGNIRISHAQYAHLGAGHFTNMHIGSDPCAGQPIGGTCTDGAIYAGTGYSSGGLNPALRYMVTPGGCTTETCTGAGGFDSVIKAWANGSGTSASNVNTGATDLNNGKLNTAILVNYSPFYTDTDAAHWCTNMNFGGYTGWYLPSKDELNYVIYNNKAALGGFASSNYWSSTEKDAATAWIQTFTIGTQGFSTKTGSIYVRCARSY